MVNVIIEEPAFTIRITGGIGAQGSKGDPGNGIASAVLNDDYTLTLNFTDGTSYTTEPIRGAQGETGNGIASAVLNPDYTLTLYFTDGTHYTTASIRGAQGEKGEKGDHGFSPIATVSKSGTVTTLTVTDEDGTTTAEILDGAPGAKGAQGIPGVSPTVTVTDITGGHRITITDAEHPGGISFDVMDGSDADAPVQDVLINGSSIVDENGDALIPIATDQVLGVIRSGGTLYGIAMSSAYPGMLYIYAATDADIKTSAKYYQPIVPGRQHTSVFYGLSKLAGEDLASVSGITVGTYPEASKSAIQNLIGGAISVSGTTPTINALPGLRYICGEVSTLTVNLPASGCVDIQFESGSTPTVLTVNPATGQTVKWANGFDPTALEADTTYEINIADGLGVCGSWT